MAEFISVVSRPLSQSEMEINATYIYNYLGSRGWSVNAIAGMLGNFEAESTINPGRYQGDVSSGSGWGLAQWTPHSKYTNWCEENGLVWHHMDSALLRIIYEFENGIQYDNTPMDSDYDLSSYQFMTSTASPYWLAGCFVMNYEKPASVLYNSSNETYEEHLQKKANTLKARGNNAEDWYEFLTGSSAPDNPDPPVDPDPEEPEIPDEPPIHTDWSEVIKDALSHWKLMQTDYTEIGDILYKVAKWAYARASSSKYGVDLENNWGPNYDNATFIISAFEANGIPVKTNGAVNASNLEDIFLRSGFVRLSNAHPYKNADIVVRTYNGQKLFDMVLSPSDYTNGYAYSTASIVDADGKSGDSTDDEIITYWRFPSASDGYYFLRFTGFKEFEPPKTRLSKLLLYAVGSDIV